MPDSSSPKVVLIKRVRVAGETEVARGIQCVSNGEKGLTLNNA
jgi:hypothetical protein